jgi:DNA-binding MarR family transcriptional regulator
MRMTHTAAAEAFTHLILTVFRLNSELIAAGDRMTKNLRLSSARWQILGQIAHGNETLTVSQIARNMGLQRQTVQPQVDALVKDGLVEFTDNPHHRRAKLIRMTTPGRRAYRETLRRQVGWSNDIARGISAKTLTQTDQTMQTLLERLQAQT